MLKRLFGYDSSVTTVRRELVAGVTTFLAMSYILAINPIFLAEAGMDAGAVFTATALAAAITTLIAAFYTKLPIALASGMGLNTFFAYTLVLGMGYSWQQALTAVLIEGIVFILLTLLNIRERIALIIPKSLQASIGIGVGFLLVFIGLRNSGIIVSDEVDFLKLGSFTPETALAIISAFLCSVFLIFKVRGGLLLGILLTALIAFVSGLVKLPGDLRIVSMPVSIEPVFCKFDFSQIFTVDMIVAILLLIFMDIFDTMGTLMASITRIVKPDVNGRIPGVKRAMLTDACGTTIGAILGTSTVTTFLECTAGIADGGRSGLTAFSTGIMFLIAIFFAPLFMMIPPSIITGALVIVGLLIIGDMNGLPSNNIRESIPAIITIVMMIMSSSIAEGISAGVVSYTMLNLVTGGAKELPIALYLITALLLLRYYFI